MGSPLSPIIADIVMQDLERVVLETFDFDIPFYYRYVDDIMLTVPNQKLILFLKNLTLFIQNYNLQLK